MESRDNDDELNFSPALPIDEANADQDVLRYLRGVRNEASTMNQILYYNKSEQEDEDPVALSQQADVVADIEFDAWSTQLVNKFKLLKEKLHTHDVDTIPYDDKYSLKWKTAFKNSPPDVNYFLYALDRKICFDILLELTKRLSITMKDSFGQWIWKVFLKLDNILEASECSILRELAKTAIKLKSKLEESTTVENSVAAFTFDMIIVIVGTYYGQSDLLQER